MQGHVYHHAEHVPAFPSEQGAAGHANEKLQQPLDDPPRI